MSHQSLPFGGRQIALRVGPGIVASYCRSRVLISWQAADRALRFEWRSTGLENGCSGAHIRQNEKLRGHGRRRGSPATMAAVFRYEVTPVSTTVAHRFDRWTGKIQICTYQKA